MEEHEVKEQEIKEEIKKPVSVDVIKIRCPKCGHRTAERTTEIRNIREACFLCQSCGQRIK